MGRVDGKIALITGAAMGIGRAVSETLAREGATVVLTDIQDTEGQQAAEAINSNGGSASYYHHDVTQEEEWEQIVDAIRQRHGGLDVLVNNAGIAIASPVLQMSLSDFQRQNAINLDGVFLGLKHGIPLMAESGGGSAINLSSVAGLKGSAGMGAYCLTKGGVRLLSKSVALECAAAQNRVRVNSVHPGIIETAIWDKMGLGGVEAGTNQVDVSAIATAAVPGGVLGKPQDIANAILFLASDDASYMTGSEVVVDHGFSA